MLSWRLLKKVTLDIPLTEEAAQLQEFVVSVGRRTDTDFELIRSMKDLKAVVVGIPRSKLAEHWIRDAAQVLKRVPGINIKDDQFVVIRGLAERYNP